MQNQLSAIKFISSIILPQIAVMPVLVYTPRVYINFSKSITDQCTVAMAIRVVCLQRVKKDTTMKITKGFVSVMFYMYMYMYII